MSESLDNLYLPWLYQQVGGRSVKETDRSRTHWELLRQLYSTQFIWLIPNDDNRAEDGRLLRFEFVEDKGFYEVDPDWMGLGCSFLEMLVGLARRLSFEAEGSHRVWFWHLIENLGLTDHTDRRRWSHAEVEDKVNTVIWRTFSYDGHGGLFPLKQATRDQREVEIWYQMNSYLLGE